MLIGNSCSKLNPLVNIPWPRKVSEMATKPVLLQKHSLGGCSVYLPLLKCHWGTYRDTLLMTVWRCVACCCCVVSALHRYSPMKLSVAFVVDELAFRDTADCVEFMTSCGIVLMPDGSHINCKQSVAAVLAQWCYLNHIGSYRGFGITSWWAACMSVILSSEISHAIHLHSFDSALSVLSTCGLLQFSGSTGFLQ